MLPYLHAILYTGVALLVLTTTGNWACRELFRLTGMTATIGGAAGGAQLAGRIIGSLERLLIAAGVISQSWEVMAAVIALKTVARFKELDDKASAEYFLVGSLFSVLWAVSITGAWIGYDHRIGINIRQATLEMLGSAPTPVIGDPPARLRLIS